MAAPPKQITPTAPRDMGERVAHKNTLEHQDLKQNSPAAPPKQITPTAPRDMGERVAHKNTLEHQDLKQNSPIAGKKYAWSAIKK